MGNPARSGGCSAGWQGEAEDDIRAQRGVFHDQACAREVGRGPAQAVEHRGVETRVAGDE